ncbi:retrovirus-related Pol polyprotein from transposon TNT 1-94 [Senna tora]|uniref:Retrovirus-related Pol polyprotein from transposon TNT 1-94 n=1 Tax=Senna tora TaxID=362788 RepID=A0A835CI08_9FABA|nr:retrovirus-related Pol polyprotein from transposon TNT 1-94 [Senna tora]
MTSGDGTKSEVPSQRKTISPCDITSLDNPGLLITQVQLRGENYDEWACSVRTALRARKKFGFVDGTIKKPDETSDDLEDWWTINWLLVSWIRNTIEPTLRSTISHYEVARDLWKDIKDRFSVTNGPRIQQLKAELGSCTQKGKPIADYYGKLKQLWDEIDSVDPHPTCKCGKCSCDLNLALDKRREDDRVHLFLLGLDSAIYSTVRSSILAQEPLPNLNKVYSILVQEERVRIIAREKEEGSDVVSSMALVTRTRDQKVVCTHCKKAGHESSSCFALIGYPEWWGDRSRGDGKSSGTGRGRGGKNARRAHAVQTTSTEGTSTTTGTHRPVKDATTWAPEVVLDDSENEWECDNRGGNAVVNTDEPVGQQSTGSNEVRAENELLGRGHRRKEASTRLRNYVTHTIKSLNPSVSSSTSQHPSDSFLQPLQSNKNLCTTHKL